MLALCLRCLIHLAVRSKIKQYQQVLNKPIPTVLVHLYMIMKRIHKTIRYPEDFLTLKATDLREKHVVERTHNVHYELKSKR